MKFLLDMPISPKVGEWLKTKGLDSVHSRNLGLSRSLDEEILEYAAKEGRIILTMDTDFPAILAFTKAGKPGVILFRMEYPHFQNMQKNLEILFKTHQEAEIGSAITIIEDERIRIRHLPII